MYMYIVHATWSILRQLFPLTAILLFVLCIFAFLLQEHMEAVEARRRQEEEQRQKRIQQMEEERRMAEELLRKRIQQEV